MINLIRDPWLPVIRADGGRSIIAPWQLTEDIGTGRRIVALDTPRFDFNGSLIQFLIALLQTTGAAPEDEHAWEDAWDDPPTPHDLKLHFEPVAHAFDLAGDGPRFMQDLDPLAEGDPRPIASVLIEAPGEKTIRDHLDHFVQGGKIQAICPSCAAMALFSLQTNAPSGGKGHRTSLRGGGPLTTLVVPDTEDGQPSPLWHAVWMNVLTRKSFDNLPGNAALKSDQDRFPWLAPTRISEPGKGSDTSPDDAPQAQYYWSMPRRIRLDTRNTVEGRCDLCGAEHAALITHYVTRPYGVNYTVGWLHPLSPHSRGQDGGMQPRHPQPGGIGYRDWLGLVLGVVSEKEQRIPAAVVQAATREKQRRRVSRRLRLWAFGYDMDNMKARCWYEGIMPFYYLEGVALDRSSRYVSEMIKAARTIAGNTRTAVKEAWFKTPSGVRGDLSFVDVQFWGNTEAPFYQLLNELTQAVHVSDDLSGLGKRWLGILNNASLSLFDELAERNVVAYEDPKRLVAARGKLGRFNSANNLRESLGIPVEKKRKAG